MSSTGPWSQLASHFAKTIRHHAGLQFATVSILTACFTLVIISACVGFNLTKIMTLWGQTLEVSVYLKEEATDPEIAAVDQALKSSPLVTNVSFISSETAIQSFKDQMANYAPDLLDNPDIAKAIPKSFQFGIQSSVAPDDHIATTETIANSLRNLSAVEEVSYGQEWVKNYAKLVGGIEAIGWSISLIILIAIVFVVSNSIRTSIAQRRTEIEVLELIGATPKYIRRPFLYEGAVIGGFSFALAWLVSLGLFDGVLSLTRTHLSFLNLASQIEFLPTSMMGVTLLSAMLLGVFAAYACLLSINDGWAAAKRTKQQ